MSTTVVSTTATLTTALKAARPGDTILLASGAYNDVVVKGLDLGGVTVASQNPGAPAVITSLDVYDSSGLTFRDLEVRVANTGSYAVELYGVRDVNLVRLDVHGSLDGNPQNDGRGVLIRESDNVTVDDSEFHELDIAISHANNTHLTIRGSDFHDLRMDGVRGGGTSWLTIRDNTFRDFKPVEGDHADAIQIWTKDVAGVTHDIIIADNLIQRGVGRDTQGIFLNDEDLVGYERITISGNLVSGGSYNGIHVRGARDVTITDNIVQGFTDKSSYISVDRVDDVLIADNQANKIKVFAAAVDVAQSGNTLIALASDQGAWALQAWQAAHGDAPGGGLNLMGDAGANTLIGGALADTLAGGAGSDVLAGGGGDDVYVVEGGDVITELAGGGLDTVRASAGVTLAEHVERLELTGVKAAYGYGNDGANTLTGNTGDNHLRGKGGADALVGGAGRDKLDGGQGADTITGGAGADTFTFRPREGLDVITDFAAGGEHDVLDLSALYAAGFTATIIDTAEGVTLRFSNGHAVSLLGVDPAQLTATPSGYIF